MKGTGALSLRECVFRPLGFHNPVTVVDLAERGAQRRASGMIRFRVAAPDMPRALPHHLVAGPAHPDAFGQGGRGPRPVPGERGSAPAEPEAAPGLDRPSRWCPNRALLLQPPRFRA